jgi:hypothetical protein
MIATTSTMKWAADHTVGPGVDQMEKAPADRRGFSLSFG